MTRVHGPFVIVHNIGHARDCVAMTQKLGRPVTLISPPGAVASMGPDVFLEIIAQACDDAPQEAITAVMDCGNDPGQALAALRAGCNAIRLDADAGVLSKLRDMAGSKDAVLDGTPLALFDMAEPTATPDALQRWLTR